MKVRDVDAAEKARIRSNSQHGFYSQAGAWLALGLTFGVQDRHPGNFLSGHLRTRRCLLWSFAKRPQARSILVASCLANAAVDVVH